tara:strand:- start:1411 stop:1821 length:411 start_codon:yes stop_codon:yes gene_type:complete
MTKSKLHEYEKAVILLLNTFDGWKLEHAGGNEIFDASGLTPKGRRCVIEMKFRTKYYEDKMLEVKKYNGLMELDKDIIKIYFVSDPEGTYMFWLDGIGEFEEIKKYCPATSYWLGKRETKSVFLLPESIASYVYKK